MHRTFLLSCGTRQQSTLCSMYLNAFENGDIPHEGFLTMNDLPSVVHWSEDESKSNSLSIEGV